MGALTKHLDPGQYLQENTGLPVFWAVQGGGDDESCPSYCHYVGHYKCVNIQRLDADMNMRNKPRIAKLTFKHVSFDTELSNKLSNIRRDLCLKKYALCSEKITGKKRLTHMGKRDTVGNIL